MYAGFMSECNGIRECHQARHMCHLKHFKSVWSNRELSFIFLRWLLVGIGLLFCQMAWLYLTVECHYFGFKRININLIIAIMTNWSKSYKKKYHECSIALWTKLDGEVVWTEAAELSKLPAILLLGWQHLISQEDVSTSCWAHKLLPTFF